MPSFDSLLDKQVSDSDLPEEYSAPSKQTNLLSKVFGVMFILLLATAFLSYGIAYLFRKMYDSNPETPENLYTIVLIVSFVGLLVMVFVLSSVFQKGKHSIIPALSLYIVLLSVVLSMFYLMYDLFILIVTFGCASLIFGIMALLGLITKGTMKNYMYVITGVIVGCIAISIANVIIQSEVVGWIVSFSLLAIIMYSTKQDVKYVKDMIYSGSKNSYNLVLYGAFTLYMDFIFIFIDLLPLIVEIVKKDK